MCAFRRVGLLCRGVCGDSAALEHGKKLPFFGKGSALFGQYYPAKSAEKAKKAAVVVAHGIHQHSGLYEDFCHRLSTEGYGVLAYDHRGFGRSKNYEDNGRSQIAEWVSLDVPSAAGDLRDAVLLARELSGTQQVFVFGHSLGGLAAVLLATSEDNPAAGFVLSNPTLQWPGIPLDKKEIDRLKAMDPDYVQGNFSQEQNSSNEAFIRFWNSLSISPHIDHGMPVRVAYWTGVCVDAIPTVRSRLGQFKSPALLLRGGEDIEVCEWHSLADLVRSASKDAALTLVNYPGAKHELIFEHYPAMKQRGGNVVVDDVVDWLKRQTTT